MAFFTKYRSKPTQAEHDQLVKDLLHLYTEMDMVDPDRTEDWQKVANLNEAVTNRAYEYQDKFGKDAKVSAEKEALYLDAERRRALAN